jgi:hypothetical protein
MLLGGSRTHARHPAPRSRRIGITSVSLSTGRHVFNGPLATHCPADQWPDLFECHMGKEQFLQSGAQRAGLRNPCRRRDGVPSRKGTLQGKNTAGAAIRTLHRVCTRGGQLAESPPGVTKFDSRVSLSQCPRPLGQGRVLRDPNDISDHQIDCWHGHQHRRRGRRYEHTLPAKMARRSTSREKEWTEKCGLRINSLAIGLCPEKLVAGISSCAN